MKKILIILIQLLSINALASVDLNSVIIPSDYRGVISSEQMNAMADVIKDLGEEEILNAAIERAGVQNLNGLKQYIKVCSIENTNTLGHFTSGPETVFYGLRTYEDTTSIRWPENIQKKVEEAFKVKTYQEVRFNKLVLKAGPVICLRAGKTLIGTSLTLAHELSHFVYDHEHIEAANSYSDVNDYIHKKLHNPGGEVPAYLLEANMAKKANEKYGLNLSGKLLETIGEIDSPDLESLSSFILDELEYRESLTLDYGKVQESKREEIILEQNRLLDFQVIYFENYSIFEKNIEITESNMKLTLDQIEKVKAYIVKLEDNTEIFKKNIEIIKKSISQNGNLGEEDLEKQLKAQVDNKKKIEEAKKTILASEKRMVDYEVQLELFKNKLSFYTKIIEEY